MSHFVKCKVCSIKFDRDVEPTVDAGGRRYAHAKCMEGYIVPQDETDLTDLHHYLQELFKDDYNYVVLDRQIQGFVKTNGYSYSGILKSLIYWYDIKHESLERADGRLGIVPYIYDKAYKYYLAMYVANEANLDKNLDIYRCPEVREVTIKPPTRNLPRRKLFNLDD